MIISQLIRPEDLAVLNERQLEIIHHTIAAQLVSSPEVHRILEERVRSTVAAVKSVEVPVTTTVGTVSPEKVGG